MNQITKSQKGDIVAHVKLYETSQGGRRGPTPRDELGCKMAIDGEILDVRLYFGPSGPLHPGQSANISIRFLFPDHAKPHLRVGKRFVLSELNSIGEGTIRQVLLH